MMHFKKLSAALLASTALAGAAHADVTAQQVWEAYSKMMTMGPGTEYSVGSETTEGSALVLRDVVVSSDVETSNDVYGETITTRTYSTATYPELRLTENGDGTVTLTMPGVAQLITGGENPDGESYEAKLEIEYIGYEDVVSGDADKMRHDSTADSARVELIEITEGGATVSGPTKMMMTDMDGWFIHDTSSDMLDLVGDGTLGQLSFEADLDMGEDGKLKAIGSGSDLKVSVDMAVPMDIDPEADEFPEGMEIKFGYAAQDLSVAMNIESPDGPVDVAVQVGSDGVELDLSEKGFSFDQSSKDFALSIMSAEFPFPIDLSGQEIGMGMLMPFGKSDEAQPAGMKVILDSAEINPAIWNMFDPAEHLPRGPVTLRVDLGAQVKVLADLLTGEADDVDMPFAPISATINELSVDAVGLTVDGTGDIEFDESDVVSYDGMPAPIGKIALDVTGVNGLLDALSAMGLVQDEQAMMSRMMMGMFAKPTGDDALSSEIEFKEGGQIFANGQRLK